MRRPVSGRDAVRSQVIDVLEAQIKRRPAMKKVSTVAARQSRNFSQPKLTIGLDPGDRWSWYCVLDEAGAIVLEQKLGTTRKAITLKTPPDGSMSVMAILRQQVAPIRRV
jgi:hypothetical protein